MKIIITERQINEIIKGVTSNPCPNDVKISEKTTLKDLLNGETLSFGYCNNEKGSAIVSIQNKLQEKGLMDKSLPKGYFGGKTLSAICELMGVKNCDESVKIGKRTLIKLLSKNETSLFDKLSDEDKIVTLTLVAEAGGEENTYKAMKAVSNVLYNRLPSTNITKEFKKYPTMSSQAMVNKGDFSCWNSKNYDGKTKEEVYEMWDVKNHKQLNNAIKILKGDYKNDITGGSTHYYNPKKTGGFPWKKKIKHKEYGGNVWYKEWVPIKTIGNHKFGKYVINKYKVE